MSDRMEFWGVYIEGHDVERPVCLCLSESEADKVRQVFMKASEQTIEVRHVEVVASIDLDIKDY